METSTVENYLKTIHRLEHDGGKTVAIGRIATELSVTPGTVTTMMKQLSTRGLVIYQPRHGVRLSEEGNRAALKVLRRHRLLELFLVEVLGLDWSDVHEEAEVLEHAISDKLLTRIDEMLGHPSCDPHGSPIPDSQGRLPEQEATPLSAVAPGTYTLIRVLGGEDNSFLAWLADHHLRPGARFDLIDHDNPAGILRLRTESRDETQLGTVAAHRLLVRKTEKKTGLPGRQDHRAPAPRA